MYRPSIESEEVRREVHLAGAILVPIGLLHSSRQNLSRRKQLIFYDFSVEPKARQRRAPR